MAVGAKRVAGVLRPIFPDYASLHPGYAGCITTKPDGLGYRALLWLARHWGRCGFRSAWAASQGRLRLSATVTGLLVDSAYQGTSKNLVLRLAQCERNRFFEVPIGELAAFATWLIRNTRTVNHK